MNFVLSRKINLVPSSVSSELSENIAKELKITPVKTIIKKFVNGETYVNIQEDVRNTDVYILPTIGPAINDNLMETYLKADAAKRMGAHRVIAILPNFPYGRQERRNEPGEPISARLNLALLHSSGVDEVITTDIHASALQGFARQMKLTDLNSLSEMTEYIRENISTDNLVIVSPDLGGVKRADRLAQNLGCDKAIIYKQRTGHNEAKAQMLLGDVNEKDCIIYDDLIDTAGTICEAANMLKDNGADNIYVCASHGLFNGPALERLENSPIEQIIVTNSEMRPNSSRIKHVDISKLIVRAIQDIST